ncbi:uncharacterized protein N7479_007987 [Penicillium vulpinum]|uniref:uncharacterized protein n=1 Tax=Penicillium vulpinum TaxID=29845 RepID=UPI002548E198|nr:uncharacterized protein N7479_007987 [Penicillium vulpinum]KAJ5960837.1 hypothetical protein N7479_007987 [Penicillium vulpinum]
MTIRLNKSHISVIHHGNGEDPSQALLWLCLAVRVPKAGWISTSQKITESSYGCRKFLLGELEGIASSAADASCWHPLFESAVVVVEPSVNITPGSLLQVDFNTLVKLAAVEYAVSVDSGVVLLGYSTALIPVKTLDDDTILWHLEVCPHESQFKVSRLQATKTEWLVSADIEVLKSRTARVGWCSKSKVLLGTASLLKNPVGWSTSTTQRKSWSWKGVSLQAVATSTAPLQVGLQGGATFERITNTLRFDLSRNYLQLLRSSSREAIIVYDVSTKRGWLVPLLNVLHHMAITYCQNGIADEDRGLPIPLAKPEANGGISSLKALWQSGSVEIETGGDDTLTLRDLLMGFSANLAKISPQKPRRGEIFGYEFMDVAQGAPTANLKRGHIKSEGHGWTSLLQSLPCLFCSNLGDAIVAKMATNPNSECCRLITGRDYLAASLHSINDISTRKGRGRIDGNISFPGDASWRPTTVLQGCDHTDGVGNCWVEPTFLQQIRKKTAY